MDADTLLKALGQAIAGRRRKLGYSQETLADAVGLHRTYMSGVERGIMNVSIKKLLAIAAVLQCPVSTLLGEAELRVHLNEDAGSVTRKKAY